MSAAKDSFTRVWFIQQPSALCNSNRTPGRNSITTALSVSKTKSVELNLMILSLGGTRSELSPSQGLRNHFSGNSARKEPTGHHLGLAVFCCLEPVPYRLCHPQDIRGGCRSCGNCNCTLVDGDCVTVPRPCHYR